MPLTRSNAQAGWIILAAAAALRLSLVFFTAPVLSDDHWRYLHDGATLAGGHNPYEFSPAEVRMNGLDRGTSNPAVLDAINHSYLVTVYQPASQWVFAALWSLPNLPGDDTGERTFRLWFALLDIGVAALLLWQLRRMNRSPWWAVLYAWHPLAVTEIAGSGHQDVVGILLMLATLMLADRHGDDAARTCGGTHPWNGWASGAMGVTFGAAAAVNPVVLPLGLFIAWRQRSAWRGLLIAAATAGLTILALYVPFMLMSGGLGSMVRSLRLFAAVWEFNGSLNPLIQRAVRGDKSLADGLCAGLLVCVLIGCLRARLDLWRGASAYLLASLLLTSVLQPWHVLWALALVPISFNAATWVLSLTVALSYVALTRAEYDVPVRFAVAEYGPVYAVLVGMYLVWRRKNAKPQASPEAVTG